LCGFISFIFSEWDKELLKVRENSIRQSGDKIRSADILDRHFERGTCDKSVVRDRERERDREKERETERDREADSSSRLTS
jgi:hypothetical protein